MDHELKVFASLANIVKAEEDIVWVKNYGRILTDMIEKRILLATLERNNERLQNEVAKAYIEIKKGEIMLCKAQLNEIEQRFESVEWDD